MTFEQVIAAIKDVGFPIIVTGYLLFRLERTMFQLRDSLSGLRTTLAVFNQPWSGVERRRPRGATGTREPWQRSTDPEGPTRGDRVG